MVRWCFFFHMGRFFYGQRQGVVEKIFVVCFFDYSNWARGVIADDATDSQPKASGGYSSGYRLECIDQAEIYWQPMLDIWWVSFFRTGMGKKAPEAKWRQVANESPHWSSRRRLVQFMTSLYHRWAILEATVKKEKARDNMPCVRHENANRSVHQNVILKNAENWISF